MSSEGRLVGGSDDAPTLPPAASGRLAYWQANAELSHRLFYEQVHDPNQQDEAVENLARFIRASREVERLTDGEGMEWLYN